jgi:hypothetical protein
MAAGGEMDRVPKRRSGARGESVRDEGSRDVAAAVARQRQAAAALLRAARLTDDPSERESLRRKAAELLEQRPWKSTR